MVLALVLGGVSCTAVEQRTVDACSDLKPGEVKMINIRPSDNGCLGLTSKQLACPWTAQLSVFVKRDEKTHLCEAQSQQPAASNFLNEASSPASWLANHAAVPLGAGM